MKLKICGMKYPENITKVATLQPDYLGFIFYEKSSRYFDGKIPKLQDNINKVGVFVDAGFDDIISKVEQHHLQLIQLHGNESPELCSKLKRHYQERNDEVNSSKTNGLPRYAHNDQHIEIIKVFSIDDEFNFNQLEPYESVCDFYLFDTKGKLPGGNGYTFNWDVLKNYPSSKPYFLSGGIGLESIENLKAFLKRSESQYCHAIDINSQFELEAGLKNIEKIKEFIMKCHFE